MPRGGKSKATAANIAGSSSDIKSSSDDAAAADESKQHASAAAAPPASSRSGPASQLASAPVPSSAPASRCDYVPS